MHLYSGRATMLCPTQSYPLHHLNPSPLGLPAEEGIEAVHLYSGRTVCRLHLPSPGLNADLNGDGVPDHIVARGGDPADLPFRSWTGHKARVSGGHEAGIGAGVQGCHCVI